MFFFRSNTSREMILRSYLRSHHIPYKSEKAKRIRNKMKEIVLNDPKVKEEAEQILVGMAVVGVGIEEEKKKEKLIEEVVTWICFCSGAVAALFVFKDIQASTHEGAMRSFKKYLSRYLNEPLEI